MSGLAVGDEKQVTLPPEDAYGVVNPEASQEIPLEQIPENARQEGQEGNKRQIKVSEIREETALLDFNHPLKRSDAGIRFAPRWIPPGTRELSWSVLVSDAFEYCRDTLAAADTH